jgi:hypothetical protein
MELKQILKIILKDGGTFYSYYELADIISKRFGYNYGIRINAKIVRSIGIKDNFKKVQGRTIRGFWLNIEDYTDEQIRMLIDTPRDHPVYKMEPELVHKKVRFLIRDWDMIPTHIQLQYKKHKELYLREIMTGCDHNTGWFYDILREDIPNTHYEGSGVDFIIRPAKDIIHHLSEAGAIKKALDKMHYLFTEHGFVRINDFVYGKMIFNAGEENGKITLPDW